MNKSKLVFTAGLGTLFESFDFYLFSLFAISLNYSFFGSVNKHSVLWIFLIFAVGYFARIVGALVFGYWGDKLGRLYSFKKTVVIMAISSIFIGFLPTYQSVGILAVVFLIILRFIQGISYGGEMSGAVIVILENYKKNQPLLIMCICLMSVLGVFLAKFTYSILGYFFDPKMMMHYGWRIAYIVAGILIFHSYFSRKDIAESNEFKVYKRDNTYRNTIKLSFLNNKLILIMGVLSLAGAQLYWGYL
jgi:MFS family permease